MELNNSERSAQFLQRFHAQRDILTSKIASLSRKGASIKLSDIQAVAAEANQLSKDVTGALSYLPAYDQRLCDQQIKKLESDIDSCRQAISKPKFSFRKNPSSTASSTAPTPTKMEATQPISPPVLADALLDTQSASTPKTASTTNYNISNLSNSYISLSAIFSPTASDAPTKADLTISSLNDCLIDLVPPISSQSKHIITALYVRSIRNTVIIAAPVEGSVRIEDCENCLFVLGGRQFRMEHCHSSDVYLHVSSNPVIEESSKLRFAEYPPELYLSPSLSEASNHHNVKDFSWIRATPSPNWTKLVPSKPLHWREEIDGFRAAIETTDASTRPDASKQAVHRFLQSTLAVEG